MENRKLLTVDEEALKAEARSLAGEFAEYMARCKSAADELEPYYRQMYLKSLEVAGAHAPLGRADDVLS